MSAMNERQRIDNSRRVLYWYDFLCPFCYSPRLGLTLPLPLLGRDDEAIK
jgi:hypothetical protein